ncbi:SDR family oxidoreductase [Candidatus Kaiserbacteria bacterium]|nr:SDR family oxidoreductase [Candidatus Kaiserbacteria bacterium]
MELAHASVVVTGAARGLGAALARELTKRGAKVFLSDISGPDLTELGLELDAPTMHCNVTDREQVVALGRAAMDAFGRIDIWINNAGVWMPYATAENIDFNKARQLVEVNYFGTAFGMLEAVRHMRERSAGVILNILSVRSLKGKALGAAYSASKFAAEGFTQAVRDELKETGIKVVGVYPYRIKTGLFGEDKHEDYDSSMEPHDVARIIVENLAVAEIAEHVEIWKTDDVRTRAIA